MKENAQTTLTRPLATPDVDFVGTFDINSFTSRACKITKGHVCIFDCFSTKAIHLGVVADLTTDNFLFAFNPLKALRSCSRTIFFDNETNFVGVSLELAQNAKAFIRNTTDNVCSNFVFRLV